MQEGTAHDQNNWLQLYVDAVTEKNPYKRLELVRRLREVPRRDESDENPERPRLQIVPRPSAPKPAPRAATAPAVKAIQPARRARNQKPKTTSRPAGRSARLKSA